VLSGRGLCDELITRPEESYRLWCVVVCDLWNIKNGCSIYIYICDISTLRVKQWFQNCSPRIPKDGIGDLLLGDSWIHFRNGFSEVWLFFK